MKDDPFGINSAKQGIVMTITDAIDVDGIIIYPDWFMAHIYEPIKDIAAVARCIERHDGRVTVYCSTFAKKIVGKFELETNCLDFMCKYDTDAINAISGVLDDNNVNYCVY